MRAGLVAFLLVPVLAGCHAERHERAADTGNFGKRMECAELATSDKWDDAAQGPYLDTTYYSPAKDTCVFVMRNSHRGEKDAGIHNEVFLVDALTRKKLWSNDPEAGLTDDQLSGKLNEQLQGLGITQ